MENFAAFFSYVRLDDEHENGRLTRLHQKIEGEVRFITGESFEIFQDDQDIHWGEKWQERLNDTLDSTTFLIIAVTPSYLKRPACRDELQRFLEHERKLGRKDLILPILYLETPALSDKEMLAADPLAQAITNHQYFDWRDLRHEPDTNPDVGKRVEKMAREIEKAMRRTTAPAPKPAPKIEAANPAASEPVTRESEPSTPKISPRNEPTELVVDPMPRRGDYTKIMDAIKAAEPGTRILIHPGLYKEALVLEKALELLGDGERDEIIVETFGASVLVFKTEFGRIANLTLRQTGGGNFFGVNMTQGRLELEDCDITSQSLACIAIHDGADPRLRRNYIHDGNQAGLVIYNNGKGTLEDNDIFANTTRGVAIQTSSDPTLRRNRIHHGKKSGVFITENSKGTLEDNDIFANAFIGLVVRDGGLPVVRNNRITKNKQYGIKVLESGGGTFKNNDLSENGMGSWAIDESSQANVKKSGNIES